MRDHDALSRFVFEHLPVRGEIARLDASWQTLLEHRDYPPCIRRLLGEAMAAASLLAATIKFDGLLTLQIQSQGHLRLLLVQCSADHGLRGLARWEDEAREAPLGELCAGGVLNITIDPGPGQERYQGIVELTGDSLAGALENYFNRSEQLPTRLHLSADQHTAAGLLLQRLPDTIMPADTWQRLGLLGDTVSQWELLKLDTESLLRRLFGDEDVRLFEPQPIHFRCTCSPQRIESMLRALGQDEVKSILAEQGKVEVTCEFCGRRYAFDPIDAEALFSPVPPDISQFRH